ncbi:MAG: hypothetical protein B7Z66_03325 [Chromatiales bacterium 21-64-14]|nr:MAG: hypothetical protein B7Z66_03325 [Chromatiales bacterium 21-64-14]HQU15830.1 YIP1 family protein [Gammaproteobacteria bacterium]
MKIADRARNILLQPRQEWQVIAEEPATIRGLYREYIVPLAAIGPVALLIRLAMFGIDLHAGGRYPLPSAVGQAVLAFALNMAAVFVVALVVDVLAPTFGGRKDPIQALKVAAYVSTPGWLASVFVLVPVLTVLALAAGLYGLYLLYLGLPVVMGAPRERALGYTVVVVMAVVVVYLLIGLLAGAFVSLPTGPVAH